MHKQRSVIARRVAKCQQVLAVILSATICSSALAAIPNPCLKNNNSSAKKYIDCYQNMLNKELNQAKKNIANTFSGKK